MIRTENSFETILVPMRLTENEINNLIYSFIKFGFRKIRKQLDSPPNSIIKEIMLGVADNPTVENIMNRTLAVVIDEYKIPFTSVQREGIKNHLSMIARMFMAEPFEIRNNLGEDEGSEEFITKH